MTNPYQERVIALWDAVLDADTSDDWHEKLRQFENECPDAARLYKKSSHFAARNWDRAWIEIGRNLAETRLGKWIKKAATRLNDQLPK